MSATLNPEYKKLTKREIPLSTTEGSINFFKEFVFPVTASTVNIDLITQSIKRIEYLSSLKSNLISQEESVFKKIRILLEEDKEWNKEIKKSENKAKSFLQELKKLTKIEGLNISTTEDNGYFLSFQIGGNKINSAIYNDFIDVLIKNESIKLNIQGTNAEVTKSLKKFF